MSQEESPKDPFHYDTLDISDLHLGKSVAQAALLFEFLSRVTCKRLILNGDVIDGWKMMAKKHRKFDEMHMRVMDRINAMAAGGTEVICTAGNHDDRLRGHWDRAARKIKKPSEEHPANILDRTYKFRDHATGAYAPITIVDSYILTDPAGRRILFLHGDQFDPRKLKTKWGVALSKVGDVGYDILIEIEGIKAKKAHDLGLLKTGQFSLSKYAKHMAKEKFGIIAAFQEAVLKAIESGEYDMVVCGHIHCAEIKDNYMNSGDWVESGTALACDETGQWRLIDWLQMRETLGLTGLPTAQDENPYAAYRGITQQQLRWAQRFWPAKNAEDLEDRVETAQDAVIRARRSLAQAEHSFRQVRLENTLY